MSRRAVSRSLYCGRLLLLLQLTLQVSKMRSVAVQSSLPLQLRFLPCFLASSSSLYSNSIATFKTRDNNNLLPRPPPISRFKPSSSQIRTASLSSTNQVHYLLSYMSILLLLFFFFLIKSNLVSEFHTD